MRGTHFVDNLTLVTELCCECGMAFAMTLDFQKRRRDDRKLFYCPAGHGQHYTGQSEAEKLREEVERQKQMREAEAARRERVERERDQVARAHTRMRARVMSGVCPCCNRTFQNLMRHMQTEHAGQLDLRTLRTAFGMTQHAVASEIGISAVYVSQHENGKRIPTHARSAIEWWVDRQTPKAPASEKTT